MAKFRGYARVTVRIPIKFELDDEDAEDEDVILDGGATAAEDVVWGLEGTIDEVDVEEWERVE